jgi:hypothetical protein
MLIDSFIPWVVGIMLQVKHEGYWISKGNIIQLVL